MHEIWKFYKWGLNQDDRFFIWMSFVLSTVIMGMVYYAMFWVFLAVGWPLISVLMVVVPVSIGVHAAVKDYKRNG